VLPLYRTRHCSRRCGNQTRKRNIVRCQVWRRVC